MKIHRETLVVPTRRERSPFVDVTALVAEVVARSSVKDGLVSAFLEHTSASLVIQENADPRVLSDLDRWMQKIAPESAEYEHDDEGPDDMPGHLRTAITRTSETIPVIDGRPALGTWQAVYVWEHRRRPHQRRLVITVMGAS